MSPSQDICYQIMGSTWFNGFHWIRAVRLYFNFSEGHHHSSTSLYCTSMMRMYGVLKIKHKPCTSLGLQSSGQAEFRGVCSGYSADKSLWSLDQDSWSSGARQGSPRKIMEANKFPGLLVGPVRHKYPIVSKIWDLFDSNNSFILFVSLVKHLLGSIACS